MRNLRHAPTLAACLAALAVAILPAALCAQVSVLSSTVEEQVAAPGDHYTGSIVISNAGAAPAVVRIYKTDYSFQADGTSSFDPPGTNPRSNATWITPQASQVVVPAQSRVTVPYAVAVPATDSLIGTYWSAVMVEAAPVRAAAADTSSSVQIGSIMRYAVQVATHIGNTGTRTVAFSNPRISRSDSAGATLDVNLGDTGQRAFRPTLWVEVYDATGALKAKAKQVRGLLYPGTSLHQHFDLGTLPAGTYKAVVFADVGASAVIATQYTVTF